MRGGLRALGLVAALLALALALPLAAPLASAADTGVAYLPPSVQMEAVYEKTVLSGYAVEAPAGQDTNADGVIDAPGVANIDLGQYIPAGFTVEAVKVIVKNASDTAKLVALDVNGNVLASADIVPLSSGYEVTFPAGTTQLQIENLAAAVWQGEITVVVLSSIEVELQFQQTQIQIQGGQTIAPVSLVIKQLPAEGSFSLSDGSLEFDVYFWDSSDADQDGKAAPDKYIYSPAHSDPQNPLKINTDIKITTSAQQGTYTVKLTLYFHEGYKLGGEPAGTVKVGELSMTITLTGDGEGQAIIEEQAEEQGIPWGMLGLGAIAAIAVIFLLARK